VPPTAKIEGKGPVGRDREAREEAMRLGAGPIRSFEGTEDVNRIGRMNERAVPVWNRDAARMASKPVTLDGKRRTR
jgi:hypothetical protein